MRGVETLMLWVLGCWWFVDALRDMTSGRWDAASVASALALTLLTLASRGRR